MRVPFSYLERQFAEIDAYLADLKELVKSGDFTLGKDVQIFEERFAKLCEMPHAVGVGSGTDALILSLKALGIGPEDEVITAANTFIATVGAIAMTGARPVLVDNTEGFVIDAEKIEAAITPRTKAIIPVQYTGNVCEMDVIEQIAQRHSLQIVEDACQSISARYNDRPVGSWGISAAFSLHPLKNLNVWGDGGIIVTRDAKFAEHLRLLRNHGLINRDEVAIFGHNSRLDSLHAVIGNRLIEQTSFITSQRIKNAARLDQGLAGMGDLVRIPKRDPKIKHVYHLYILRVTERDRLRAFLNDKGVEAKIHYPIPVHLQPAAKYLGYAPGSFPKAELDAREVITLPAHQHLTDAEIDYTINCVREFYQK